MTDSISKMKIKYPYLPEGRDIKYVPANNPYMHEAENFAQKESLDKKQPTGSVLVKEGRVLGRGANGSDYHLKHKCERVKRGIPTGQGYELCEGCHPKNHSEPKAIKNTRDNGFDPNGADLYLWGHFWCCEPCWNAIIEAGIENVYLLEGSEKYFDRTHFETVIGK